MKYMNRYFWVILIGLVCFNFGVQNMNWLLAENMPCAVYVFDAQCLSFEAFLINKFVRLTSNLLAIYLVQKRYFQLHSQSLLPLFMGLLVLAGIDVYFLQTDHFLVYRIHQFVHPVVFSPLLAIILVSISIAKPKLT